ncbi:MAG: DUF3276 family protein [Tepidisphaeraceae bacterium]
MRVRVRGRRWRSREPAAAGAIGRKRSPTRSCFSNSSPGPRTYAAQVKKATNGNHYLVLTEGRRDDKTGEVYKKRLNVFSEDFEPFLDLIRAFAAFNKAHPVPDNVRQRQAALWKKKRGRKAPAAVGAVSG